MPGGGQLRRPPCSGYLTPHDGQSSYVRRLACQAGLTRFNPWRVVRDSMIVRPLPPQMSHGSSLTPIVRRL